MTSWKWTHLGQGSMYRAWSIFFKINGWAGGKRVVPCAHPPYPRTGTPHGWVSRIVSCARTGGPNSHKKDMCQLESPDDRIVRSPWVCTNLLKVALFFKSFLLRGTLRAQVKLQYNQWSWDNSISRTGTNTLD